MAPQSKIDGLIGCGLLLSRANPNHWNQVATAAAEGGPPAPRLVSSLKPRVYQDPDYFPAPKTKAWTSTQTRPSLTTPHLAVELERNPGHQD